MDHASTPDTARQHRSINSILFCDLMGVMAISIALYRCSTADADFNRSQRRSCVGGVFRPRVSTCVLAL